MVGNHPHLDAPNAVLASKLSSVFEPADARQGASHSRATKLHRVSRRNSVQLLLHALGVGPIGTYMDRDMPLVRECSDEAWWLYQSFKIINNNSPLEM